MNEPGIEQLDPSCRNQFEPGLSDEGITRQKNLAKQGLELIYQLEEVFEDLNLFVVNMAPAVAALEELK